MLGGLLGAAGSMLTGLGQLEQEKHRVSGLMNQKISGLGQAALNQQQGGLGSISASQMQMMQNALIPEQWNQHLMDAMKYQLMQQMHFPDPSMPTWHDFSSTPSGTNDDAR